MNSKNIEQIKLTRVKNDVNGNGRLVVHFLDLLTDEELSGPPFDIWRGSHLYNLALAKARKIGGKNYHTKEYGGGIVFTNYESNLRQELKNII